MGRARRQPSPRVGTPAPGSALTTAAATVRTAHAGPALAVTVLTALLCAGTGLAPARALLATVTVLTSQLSIGWSNDLIDLARDRAVGRTDKPMVNGEVAPHLVRVACGVALAATVVLGVACGAAALLAHLVNTAAGWAYNRWLKSTAWSWLPYAVAFGGLPVFVHLAARPAGAAPAWQVLAGALLGVGAHLVNVLPDLEDDARTGVRGLPHRIGAGPSRRTAVALLALASGVILLGSRAGAVQWVVAVALVGALAVSALRGGGRAPFYAAVGIALVDAVLLVSS